MNPSKFLLIAAVALTAFVGCEEEKEGNTQAHITLGEEELLVSSFGSTVSVSVQSNYDWECSYSSDWFKAENTKGGLSITYDTNETGADRKSTITVTTGKGGKNVADAELQITQSSENFDALILEYAVPSGGRTIELPISSVSNATIDWDDGEIEITSTRQPAHTYSTPGVYTVKINGTVTRLCSRRFSTTLGQYWESFTIAGTENLRKVIQWGDTGLTNIDYAFYKCSHLSSLPEGPGPFSNVKYSKGAFYSCSSLKEIPEGIFDYCSNVTDFSEVFYGCSGLTSVPENIFSGCSSVTDFARAFSCCSGLTSVPENIFSNCTKVTDFSEVFGFCPSLTSVPENIFSNCPNVTDFSYAFYGCSSLVSAPKFVGCSSVTTFSYAFCNCTSLTTIPTDIFDDSFLVTDFTRTFSNCPLAVGESPYTEIENTSGNIVKVHLYERQNYAMSRRWAIPENHNYCFQNCTGLTDYDDMPSSWKNYY